MAEVKQFRPKGSGHGNPPISRRSQAVTIAFILFSVVVLNAASEGRISTLVAVALLVAVTTAFMVFARRKTRSVVPRNRLH